MHWQKVGMKQCTDNTYADMYQQCEEYPPAVPSRLDEVEDIKETAFARQLRPTPGGAFSGSEL